MKRKIYTLAATLMMGLISFSSCDKLKDLAKVNFDLDNADGEFTIPAIIAVGAQSIDASDIYLNLDSIIKAQNSQVGANNIKEVHIKSCQLNLENGDAANNFSALESCSLEIKSNKKTEFIKMAGVSSNPDVEAQSLNLPVESGLDLKDYFISATQFSYRLSAAARKTTNKELKCKVVVKYNIVAGL